MKIGIISDSHDNITKIKEAVEMLNQKKIDFLVHCGDYVAPFALNPFKQLNCDWVGVFGNNDGEKAGLSAKSEGKIKEPPYFLNLDSKKISITHDFKDSNSDIILCGHTHKLEIKKIESQGKKKLIINPGELCGWLSGKSSLVVLDLSDLTTESLYF